jgi:hypothetical protein
MPQFNATDAIFFGFRVAKRDPVLLAALVVLSAVVAVVGTQLIAPHLVAFIADVEAFAELDPDTEPGRVLSEMFRIYGGFFGSPTVLLYLLATAVVWFACQGAILRALVREQREGWVLGIKLGGDELRAFVAWILVKLAMFGVFVVVLFVGGIVVGVLGAINQALGVLAAFLVIFGGLLPPCLLGARLCAAAPASVGERKFIIMGSWRLTQGRMWGLLGAYVVLAFIVVAAHLVVFIVTGLLVPEAASLSQGGTSLAGLENPAAALRTPGYVFVTVLSAGLEVAKIAGWSGIGAYAYRMLGPAMGYPNAHPPEDAGGAPMQT